jgi:UDP-N-acetylglucosamine 1-carboxyvinyltransferase
MPYFHITGGAPLCGSVRVSGAKNAALPMMAAALLADGPVQLCGVPELADVHTLSRVLYDVGMALSRSDDGLRLETFDPGRVRARYALVRRLRASFCVLGPLLARRGKAVVPLPGGCQLGDRPVDLHLHGLAALGAELHLKHGYIVATARRLVGTTLDLGGPRGPTVTGTANVLSAAVLAQGKTVIRGAACEPEIVDLGELLIAMGARIAGLGTPVLEIDGVEQLGGACHRIIPDRIEAATLLLAVAITGGTATIAGVNVNHLSAVLDRLDAAGVRLAINAKQVTVVADGPPRPVNLVAEPYPGVPTDVQAQWMALMTLADGASTVEDRVFPGRFRHAAELNRMGARIACRDGRATITGVPCLNGAVVTASDLRASAALVLAGLAARGHTVVRRAHHLDRGYEHLDHKLAMLGARIERVGECVAGRPVL